MEGGNMRKQSMVTLTGALALVGALGISAAQAAPPPCTEKEVVGVVTGGFDAVQEYELKSKRRLAGVDEIKDLGVVEHAAVVGKYDVSRFCQGRARLADGETIAVWFRIYAERKGKDGAFGAVRPCFAKYNPPHIGECSKDDAAVKPR
jgi:hypothetical protein